MKILPICELTQTDQIQAPWKLKRFVQNHVIYYLNFQRNLNDPQRPTDQFAAVVLSDKDLDQIDELRLRKGIINVHVHVHIKIILHP
jgi:hypothetical protein